MIKTKDILNFINEFAPIETQCSWDNSGLIVGDFKKEVKKIGFCLDAYESTIKEAIKNNADLIISHHPVIFHPQKNILGDNPVYLAIKNDIQIISVHTPFDCAKGGVNDVLCNMLEIKNIKGIPQEDSDFPVARIGDVEETDPMTFASFVSNKLGTMSRVVLGKKKIKKVALCGGAGMSFFDTALKMGADCYITGDITHHEMLDASSSSVTVIASGHFETERPAMKEMKKFFEGRFPTLETVLLEENNPVIFVG